MFFATLLSCLDLLFIKIYWNLKKNSFSSFLGMFSLTSSWNNICQFTPQNGPKKQSYLKWKRMTVWNVTNIPIRNALQEMALGFSALLAEAIPRPSDHTEWGPYPSSASPQLTSQSTENSQALAKQCARKYFWRKLMLVVFKHRDNYGEIQTSLILYIYVKGKCSVHCEFYPMQWTL